MTGVTSETTRGVVTNNNMFSSRRLSATSGDDTLEGHVIITVHHIYVLGVSPCIYTSMASSGDRDVHQYETRVGNKLRIERHRTTTPTLASQLEDKIINKLPGDIRRINEPQQFKPLSRQFLCQKYFPWLRSLR
ncbi:hypothetical protein J6590_023025 [Homalodisca vitripennis]|nr:hypothetical protein J6590_023025 [Homalodisca vitripennis]